MSGSRSPRPEGDLGAIRNGDLAAFVAHVDPWVDRMHDTSQNIVGSTDSAAIVSHEVVQSLWERRGDLNADELTRDSLLLATRQQSLHHLAAHGWISSSTDSLAGVHYDGAATRYRVTLAHAAATAIGASNVSLLDLHFRHGVDAVALADALGVAGAAAPRRLAQLRSELDEAIAAYELWSDAGPRCPGLGVPTEFDATVFETVRRHRDTCSQCARAHRSLVNPAGLFLTAPTAKVAPALRQRVLSFASTPDALSTANLSTATVVAPIAATANGDALWLDLDAGPDADPDLDLGLDPRPGASSAAAPDIDALWASTAARAGTAGAGVATAGAATVRAATPGGTSAAASRRSVPVTPSSPPARPRAATVVGGVAVLLAVLVGGVALATRGSDSRDRIVVDRGSNSEQPPTNEEEPEPEVQSLGPVPPSTERTTTSTTATATSTATSAAESTTTSSAAPTTAPTATPVTTTGTRVATGVPPRPPSTSTSTVASSPVTTAPTTEPPATSPPIATTTATTTTDVATTTTEAPTAPTTTDAPPTTEAPPTTAVTTVP